MSRIEATMRASVLRAANQVVVEDLPIPNIEADQVLVEVAAVGVCGSDAHYFHELRIGDFVVDGPLILGHEAAGTIVKVDQLYGPIEWASECR
jgi:L-iditol 2-dehydrogenase